MSDSLGDLLNKSKFREPEEIGIIKSFVQEKYKTTPSVTIGQTQIIIGVPNAALAGTLRPHLHELKALCQTKKRLLIRIN
jgi:hypothetical protein